jgi:hypothetical protein
MWRHEQAALNAKMIDLRLPSTSYDAAINAIQAISDVCHHYNDLTKDGRRALLHATLATATWQAGEFRATLETSFAKIAHSNQGSNRKKTGKAATGGRTKIWLPTLDEVRTSINNNHDLPLLLNKAAVSSYRPAEPAGDRNGRPPDAFRY